MDIPLLTETALKLFFMLTPFFVLSMFVTMTTEMETSARRGLALRATVSINAVCLILYFFGRPLFNIFAITVDSFRIGAGIILMLTAIELVRGTAHASSSKQIRSATKKTPGGGDVGDLAVVPLTIPYVVGPGTIGMLLVLGGDAGIGLSIRLNTCAGIVLASTATGLMLYFSDGLMKRLGHRSLQILSKITGLVLAALSAQSVMTGLLNIISAHKP